MFFGQTMCTENVLVGETVIAATTTLWSPWFASRGDAAIFTIEVFALSGTIPTVISPNLLPAVYTKNEEDKDSEEVLKSGFGFITNTTGVFPLTRKSGKIDGLKELVRYKFLLADIVEATAPYTMFATFHMLDPQWVSN